LDLNRTARLHGNTVRLRIGYESRVAAKRADRILIVVR